MKSISDPDSWQHTLAVAIFAQLVTAIGFNMFIPFLPLYATSLDSTLNLSIEAAAGLTMGAAGITSMFATALWGGHRRSLRAKGDAAARDLRRGGRLGVDGVCVDR